MPVEVTDVKNSWKQVAAALAMGALMPWLLLGMAQRAWGITPEQNGVSEPAAETQATASSAEPLRQDEAEPEPTQAEAPQEEPTQGPEEEPVVLPVRMFDGTVEPMQLETYLVAVVLAEMPASFEMEALKAQAVVARTYALRCCRIGNKHPQGAVCTDSGCCQAYSSPETYTSRGGTWENVERVRQAVEQTAGQVLTYNGALITATYFSCSGGTTEDAAEVWGSDVPYLQSVSSPGEESATHFTDEVRFSAEEFRELLQAEPEGSMEEWLGDVSYTEGGGVAWMEIGTERYKGTELRKLLKLRSTAFTATVEGDEIVICTRGYGHRVGMSQYGANAMAKNGADYVEILTHYYQGAVLTESCGD